MCPLFCYFCKSLAISCLSTACLKIFSSTRACIDSCKDGGQCKPLQQARTHQEAAIWALHGRGLLCMGSLNALYILIQSYTLFESLLLRSSVQKTSFLWHTFSGLVFRLQGCSDAVWELFYAPTAVGKLLNLFKTLSGGLDKCRNCSHTMLWVIHRI